MADGYVDTNGVRLWYEELGQPDGAPVVLVMGVGASVVWWPPELVAGLVDAGYRVVWFDNRDIGRSSPVDYESAPYGLGDMATDVVGLLDSIGIGRADFVGVSLGGMISQALALRNPDRVRSLVLISSTPGPDDRLSSPVESVFVGLDRPVETQEDWAELMVDFSRALTGSRYPFDESLCRETVAADIARGTNAESSHERVVPSSPSRVDDVGGIGVPTLVVHGTEDPIFPFDHALVMAEAIPDATLVTWEGVGHELPAPLVPELARLVVRHIGAGR
ncbi:MAG: alpha/beta fold hydrolase [Acidimicrobiales bacterium]